MELQWQDGGALSARDAQVYTAHIRQTMHGLTPLHGRERRQLREYAEHHGVPWPLMSSIRSGVRIAEEMATHHRAPSPDSIRQTLTQIASYPPQTHRRRLRRWLASAPIPYRKAYQVISESPDWTSLSAEARQYLDRLRAADDPARRARQAELYERNFGDWLYNQGICHRTEDDLREEDPGGPTPDYLLDYPVTIVRGRQRHLVHWIDAKDYYLGRGAWPERPLRKQAARYTKAFGPGAYVSSVGYDSSLRIAGTLILDSVEMI